MNTLFRSLVALSLLASLSSYADDSCAEIRLDSPGKSMEHVPVTFQGGLGICYAHAAAQMADAYRFSHVAPGTTTDYSRLSAPLEIAAGFTAATDPTSLYRDGAYHVSPVLDYMNQHGSCNADSVASAFAKGEAKDLAWTLEDSYNEFQATMSAQKISEQDFLTSLEQNTVNPSLLQTALALRSKIDPVASYDPSTISLKQTLLSLSLANLNEAIEKYLEPLCGPENHIDVKVPVVGEDTVVPAEAHTLDEFHKLLAQKNAQPVGIKICSNFFTEGSTYTGRNSEGGKTDDCAIHWVLVIGQKVRNGKCNYLVRNSWGTDDTGYSSDWQSEHGNLWIDEESLAHNTFEYFSLNSRNE